MRRCKKHNTDLSSLIGICASCLRDRLLTLIITQESQAHNKISDSETKPAIPITRAPIIRPPSKPRLNHSLSDKRFFNSPQIAINTGGCIASTSLSNSKKNRNSLSRFSSFSKLFKSKSSNGNEHVNLNLSRVERKVCDRDRGMSPVRLSVDGNEDELSSGFESCKQTPQKTPNRRRGGGGGGGGGRSVSEMIFCLSPLVRASPNRLWSVKGKAPPVAMANGDEIVVPRLGYTKSFYGNRSRKLADFGRPDLIR